MRAARAAAEPDRDPRAREGVLDEAEVLARRAQEHGHLVEAHAAARLVEHVARDLDGLAALAGGGEEDDVVAALVRGRFLGGEEEAAEASQVGCRDPDPARLRSAGAEAPATTAAGARPPPGLKPRRYG